MPDFDATNPPKAQTNPERLPAGAYPRHVFKRVAADSDEGIVVAWAGKTPIRNVFVDVVDEKDEAQKLADGYALDPVVDDAPKVKAPIGRK